MMDEILTLIAPRHRVREELPKGYVALTRPIAVDTEAVIIRSVWSTLSRVPDSLITCGNGYVIFWRKRPKRVSYQDGHILRGEMLKGGIKTR